jgi:hypothetical protein
VGGEGCSGTGGAVLEGEGLELYGLFLLLFVLEVEVEMLVDHLEIWHSLRNFGHKGIINIGSSLRISPIPLLFVDHLLLPVDHPPDPLRQIILRIPINNFLQNPFPPLLLLLLYPLHQINLTIPREGFSYEFILLSY